MSMNTENPELDGAPDVESAWSEVIRRRLAEVDAGTVELILGKKSARNCSAPSLPQVHRGLNPIFDLSEFR